MPPVLLTVTVVAVGRGELFSEAVTVTAVAAALSPTAAGFSDSVTAVGAVSSSVIVSVAVSAVRPVALPVRMTVSLLPRTDRLRLGRTTASPSRWSAHPGSSP